MQFEIFLVSTSYYSARRFSVFQRILIDANPLPCKVVRLEHHGESMFEALDDALAQGATRIVLRPLGMPFSQSLQKWVPNAAGDWLTRQTPNSLELAIADDLEQDDELISLVANRPYQAQPIHPKLDGLNGKGWDEPPAFEHHLLVCTGSRCHMRGSFGLLEQLKHAVAQAGLSAKCLIASTGCLFPCNRGPVLLHYPKGDWYQLGTERDLLVFVEQVLV